MAQANLLLILASAVIHVVAHVALKRARNRSAFVWWMLLWGGLLFSPVLVLARPVLPSSIWAILGISAAFEALYFASIARAYREGDLSLVYPLARGTAPVFLLAWSTLFLAEWVTPGGVGGIALIALGLYLINLPHAGAWRAPVQALRQAGPRWALLAGLCISVYTALDRVAVRQSDPLVYTYAALCLTAVLLTPATVRAVGWPGLMAELRATRLSSVVAGFTTMAAYALVLYAMRAGTPASYAGAVREISVVLGAAVGVLWLKESGSYMRLLGAVCVAGGVALIALLG